MLTLIRWCIPLAWPTEVGHLSIESEILKILAVKFLFLWLHSRVAKRDRPYIRDLFGTLGSDRDHLCLGHLSLKLGAQSLYWASAIGRNWWPLWESTKL